MAEPSCVSAARREELAKLVRAQVVAALQDDLDGELIMKEVWEACEDAAETAVAEDALRAIIALIERGA
jgi:DNA-binding transcriptional MocR family regulator